MTEQSKTVREGRRTLLDVYHRLVERGREVKQSEKSTTRKGRKEIGGS